MRDTGRTRLPPLYEPGLDVVFVGTEPGPQSLREGHYYANPSNSFYRDLHETGLTPVQIRPSEYRRVLDYGIGLDDAYHDPIALRGRLANASPRCVCFNSKGALVRFVGAKVQAWEGPAAGRYVEMDAAFVWAVPDSSPLAASYRPRRQLLLSELVSRLRVL